MHLYVVMELSYDSEWIDSIWSTMELAENRMKEKLTKAPKLTSYTICAGILDNRGEFK